MNTATPAEGRRVKEAHPPLPTYADRILADLRAARCAGESFCGADWYAKRMPTFAQRISLDLKPRGYVIESRICRRHQHASTIHEYELVHDIDAIPVQEALLRAV